MTTGTKRTNVVAESERRWWRIGQNAGALAIARVLSGLCQFLLVPVLLRTLGTETFGWAMALVALVSLSQFADLGVAMAFQQDLSEAWARNERTGIRRTYASGVQLLAWLGAGWFILAIPLAWWGGASLLPAPGHGQTNGAALAWIVVAATMTAGVPLSAGTRLAAALQLGWINAAWTAVANFGTLVAVWIAANATARPVVFVALLCAGQIAPGAFTALHLRRRLNWRDDVAADPMEMKRLWKIGRKFAAPNLAGALLQATAPWLFARFGGYAASAAFAVLQRLFGVVQQAQALLLGPFWPAYAEAEARSEIAWVRRSFRWSVALTLAMVAGLAGATALLPEIIRLWLGAGASAPAPLFSWFVAIWISAGMVAQAWSYLLLGLGRLHRIALQVAAVHATTISAMAVAGRFTGSTGVAAMLAAGGALGLLPLSIRAGREALREISRKESTPDAVSVRL